VKTWIPNERNFAYLTWKQVDALPRDRTLLVLPTAAIEQHGHHLPLATDTLINNLLLQEQRAHRLPRNAVGQCRDVSRGGARPGRKHCGGRLQEGGAVQHAWRE